MNKIVLISVSVVIFLIVTVYLLFSFKKTPRSVPGDINIPAWLNDLIEKEKNGPVANPHASLSKCTYRNQNVYYLPPRCCDVPGSVYNDKGDVICSPDGGFTGKGDGKCTDFFNTRKDCVILWKDARNE